MKPWLKPLLVGIYRGMESFQGFKPLLGISVGEWNHSWVSERFYRGVMITGFLNGGAFLWLLPPAACEALDARFPQASKAGILATPTCLGGDIES